MSKRPRLLLLTPDFPPDLGGIQGMVYELAIGLSRTWEVTVVTPPGRTGGSDLADQPFALMRTHSRWGGLGSAVALAEMVVTSARTRPDVILAGHLLVALAAVVAARGRRPVAVLLYGSEIWSRLGRALPGPVRDRVSIFLAISEFTAEVAVGAGVRRDRLRITRPGAALADVPSDCRPRLAALGLWKESRTAPEPYFVTVARLDEPHKGHDVFLRALPAIVAEHPDFRYVVAGDGELRRHLERIAETSGVTRAVIFTGRVDEPTKASLISGSRAFLMLSRESTSVLQFEGFGIAFAEAALLGKASLAGRSGAVPEVVVDNETGLLVDPSDVVAIVEASLQLLQDPGASDRMGARARARAEADFTWEIAVGRVDRILTSLLS